MTTSSIALSGNGQSIAGYCTECFDLLRVRDQCWVLVPTRSSDLLRRLTGAATNDYRPVCKHCYHSITSRYAVAEEQYVP